MNTAHKYYCVNPIYRNEIIGSSYTFVYTELVSCLLYICILTTTLQKYQRHFIMSSTIYNDLICALKKAIATGDDGRIYL